jgi:peptidoglycan DL-endopeptidase CwlO
MAFRLSSRVRSAGVATAALVAVGAAVVVPTVAVAAPHQTPHRTPPPKPTIQTVQQRLGHLVMKSDELVEKYNQANLRYKAAKRAAAKATAAYLAAEHRLAIAQDQLSTSAAAQYEGGTFSATGALLSSDSGTSYLDQLDTLSMLSDHNAQTVSTFTQTQKQAKAAKTSAQHFYAQATANRAKVADERQATTRQIHQYQDLLASLNAQQRALWLAQQNKNAVDTQAQVHTLNLKQVHITSAALKKVISFALAQVGKPYVWGASGPNSYDCSGLTMASYAHGGISLPHSAAGQYGYGHHVSFNQLQPGDLLFFYQPIGHVAMYIGDGMMVSAPQTGEDVKIIPATSFGGDYTGATRLIG